MKSINPILVLVFFVCISSCNDDPDQSTNVAFSFTHQVDGEPLVLDETAYQNEAGNDYSVETLKYFVSDFTLYPVEGDPIFIGGEHYVDARESYSWIWGPGTDVPFGEYTHITFVFGLTPEQNVTGRFPDPPLSNMEWPMAMGPGYHYMKLEGKFDSLGTTKNYQCHTGQSMGEPYFVEVTLPNSGFTLSDYSIIEINMNINNWWTGPNTMDLNDMTMIMGNAAMQQLVHENGSDVFSLVSVTQGGRLSSL